MNLKQLSFVLCMTLAFLLSYPPQKPLYFDNQNTYFLHGIASAGYGFLKNDWLANTKDPFPVFSFLVQISYSFFGKNIFYFLFWGLLIIYFWSLFGIITSLLEIKKFPMKLAVCFVIIFLNSDYLLIKSQYYLKINLFGFFNEGLAGQYLLRDSLQPCVFGVFVLLSVYLFLKNRIKLSIICLAAAAYFHASYLLISGLVFSGFAVFLYAEHYKTSSLLKIVLFYLLLSLPVIIYYYSFNEHGAIRGEAEEILYNFRIPHHANARFWISIESFLKLSIIFTAVFVPLRGKKKLIFLIPTALFITLTAIQYATGSPFLGLLFPWRITVILLPLSSSLIFSFLVNKSSFFINKKIFNYLAIPAVLFLIGIIYHGAKANLLEFRADKPPEYSSLYNFIYTTLKKSDVYLIPQKFKEFRLETGAPVYIDLKSHPYKPSELIEWYNRIKSYEYIINPDSTFNLIYLKKLIDRYKISGIVVDKYISKLRIDKSFLCPFENKRFAVLKIGKERFYRRN